MPKKDNKIKKAAVEKRKPNKDIHVPINEKISAAAEKKAENILNMKIKKKGY